ncbi:MAG: MMPL family transporter [Pirellulales bacterium]
MNRAFVVCALMTLAVLVAIAPFGLLGSYRGLQAMNNHPLVWMPRDTPARTQYEEFVGHFEHFDPVIISWAGCTIDDERLDRVARKLREIDEAKPPQERLFLRVVTGREVLDELSSRPLRLSRAAAIGRLRGSMIGPDGKSTCAVVVLTPAAAERGGETLELIESTAEHETGLARDELHLGGPTVESTEIDSASVRSLIDNILPSAIVVFVVAWPVLRSLGMTILVTTAALLVEVTILSLAYYSSVPINGILVVMPSLVFVIFTSGSVHLLNYYYDALDEGLGPRAPLAAVRAGRLPCFLATLTTAIGTGSLATSQVEPVVIFAWFATIGVIATFAVMFLLLPGAMVIHARYAGARSRDPASALDAAPRRSRWQPLKKIIVARFWLVAIGFTVSMLVGTVGVARLKATMELGDFFTEDTTIVRDHQWLEDTIGPLLPAEVVLRFDRRSNTTMHDRLVLVREVEDAIDRTRAVSTSMSAAKLLPSPSLDSDARAIARRTVLERSLEQRVDDLVRGSYLAIDGDSQLWRISVRVFALAQSDYGQSLDELRTAVNGALAASDLANGKVSVTYTGLLPLIVESRRQLLRDLVSSFASALAIIAVVLAIAFRSVGFGLLSLLPNVFPTLLVFGFLGWTGSHIDVGSMMTASIGLGIAVDGTVHYLTWYHRGIALGKTSPDAIQTAYDRCGAAMVRTTLIVSAGLIVFVFSPLLPAAQFALMICVLLLMGLVGDLVYLPALLCASAGSFARWRTVKPSSKEPAE